MADIEDLLCEAIANHRVVTFVYDDLPREVIPGVLGRHRTTQNPVLRGYQTDGSSNSRTVPFWKLFLIDKINDLLITGGSFDELPPQYNLDGDADIDPITLQLQPFE